MQAEGLAHGAVGHFKSGQRFLIGRGWKPDRTEDVVGLGPQPIKKPNTLNLWFQRNELVGMAYSSRISRGPPITAMRTGPAPSEQIGP